MKLKDLILRDRFDILLEKSLSPAVPGRLSKDIGLFMGNLGLEE
jgi:hypothetical protein